MSVREKQQTIARENYFQAEKEKELKPIRDAEAQLSANLQELYRVQLFVEPVPDLIASVPKIDLLKSSADEVGKQFNKAMETFFAELTEQHIPFDRQKLIGGLRRIAMVRGNERVDWGKSDTWHKVTQFAADCHAFGDDVIKYPTTKEPEPVNTDDWDPIPELRESLWEPWLEYLRTRFDCYPTVDDQKAIISWIQRTGKPYCAKTLDEARVWMVTSGHWSDKMLTDDEKLALTVETSELSKYETRRQFTDKVRELKNA